MEKDLLPIILERSHQSGRWLTTGKGQMSPSRQTIREREASCLFHPSVLGLWSKSPWKSFIHTQRTSKQLGTSSMDPPKPNGACPIWLPPLTKLFALENKSYEYLVSPSSNAESFGMRAAILGRYKLWTESCPQENCLDGQVQRTVTTGQQSN